MILSMRPNSTQLGYAGQKTVLSMSYSLAFPMLARRSWQRVIRLM